MTSLRTYILRFWYLQATGSSTSLQLPHYKTSGKAKDRQYFPCASGRCTYSTQLLCVYGQQKSVTFRKSFLWQAHCWKQKLCWFTQHEQSGSTGQSLKGCCFLEKRRKIAGKFCIRYKGYVNLQGRSGNGILSSKWKAFIQREVFLGKRIKHTKTSYFKEIEGLEGYGARFQNLKQPTTQTNSFSKLCSSLQTVTHKQEFNSSCLCFLPEKIGKKETIYPEYFKGKMHWWCFPLGFFVFWGLIGWWLGFLVHFLRYFFI